MIIHQNKSANGSDVEDQSQCFSALMNTTVLNTSVVSVNTVSGREFAGAKVNQLTVGYRLTARPCQMERFLTSPWYLQSNVFAKNFLMQQIKTKGMLDYTFWFSTLFSPVCSTNRTTQRKICWACPRCKCDHRDLWQQIVPSCAQTCSQPFLIGPCWSLDIAQKRTLRSKCADNERVRVYISAECSLFIIGQAFWWGDWPPLHRPSVTAWYKLIWPNMQEMIFTLHALFLSHAHADVLEGPLE